MRGRSALAAAALAVVLSTAGCGTADPGITAVTSTSLQRTVREMARLAATRQFAAAQRSLTGLEGDLRAAVASGAVTAARAARIRTALGLVAGDLRTAAASASPTASPTPAPTRTATPTPTPTKASRSTKATKAPAPAKRAEVKDGRGKGKHGKGGKGKGG